MKIIIAGDGKVGSMLTRQFSGEGHDLTLIDNNPEALESTIERYDVMSVEGNCASMEVLRNAGVEKADLLITATGKDELNLLCCMTAHGMNPNLHTIARIRTPDYAESTYSMRKTFALSLTVNPDRQTAREIDRLLRYPGFLKREKFANGLVEIVEIKVDATSPLKDQPLNQLSSITNCQVLVCAALREGKSVTPDGNFVIREGDRLFVTASAKNLTILLRNIGYVTQKVRNVMIVGGGSSSYYLADLLLKEGVGVKIVEKEMSRCEHLAEMLPGAVVVQGDASLQAVLEREKIRLMDAVISMTGLDELNVITSIYANHAKVPHVITKLGRAENLDILAQLPVGSIVSPKELCTNTIATYVRAMGNQIGAAVTVHSIAGGQAVAIEFIVDATTKNTGRPLKEIRLKKNVLVASITHGRNIIFPNGESVFRQGDRIIIVSNGDAAIHHLNDIFVS
ncbi:MAG: Trk system potassium transporter TrkA [Lachnospiraceae bacterium]|nr:Trk system potassium transporter TrkA [Lachnospiraceae bacterium]